MDRGELARGHYGISLSRRSVILAPLGLAVSAYAAGSKTSAVTLSIRQESPFGAGFQRSLEGWSRAGIKNIDYPASCLMTT